MTDQATALTTPPHREACPGAATQSLGDVTAKAPTKSIPDCGITARLQLDRTCQVGFYLAHLPSCLCIYCGKKTTKNQQKTIKAKLRLIIKTIVDF